MSRIRNTGGETSDKYKKFQISLKRTSTGSGSNDTGSDSNSTSSGSTGTVCSVVYSDLELEDPY